MIKYKKVAVSLLFVLLLVGPLSTNAYYIPSSTETQIATLVQLIQQLQAQLKNLQTNNTVVTGENPNHTYQKTSSKIDGSATIDISSPLADFAYDKSNPLTDTIDFNWKALNVPNVGKNQVVVETVRTKTFSYSTALGGQIWSGELPSGDSTGTYKIDISGDSSEGAGLYKARVKIRNCNTTTVSYCDDKTFKVLAESPWVSYSIVDKKSDKVAIKPYVKISVEGISDATFTTSPYTDLDITIHPSVGVYFKNCTINKKYEGGSKTETFKFNKVITEKDYGRTVLYSVDASGPLLSVSVSCVTKDNKKVVDTVGIIVLQSPLKKLTEAIFNGRLIGDYNDSTEIEMMTFCRGNLEALKKNNVEEGDFTCTWGNETVIEEEVYIKG